MVGEELSLMRYSLFLLALLIVQPLYSQEGITRCADPESGLGLVNYVQLLMTRNDSSDALTRKQAQLPVVPSDSVALSRDSVVCLAAAQAYNREAADSGLVAANRRVNVIVVGDKYIVEDPTTPLHAGEWAVWYVFDSRWKKIVAFGS